MKNKLSLNLYHREETITRLLPIVTVVMLLSAGVLATLTLRDIRSSARGEPANNEISIPPATTTLKAPYIRLVPSLPSFQKDEPVMIDVYIHTVEKQTAEANMLLVFDPKILEFDADRTINTGVYKIMNARTLKAGLVEVTLFNNPHLDDPPVSTTRETKIARLSFTAKTVPASLVQITLDYEENTVTKTSLVPYEQERAEVEHNLLQSAEGVVFSITP